MTKLSNANYSMKNKLLNGTKWTMNGNIGKLKEFLQAGRNEKNLKSQLIMKFSKGYFLVLQFCLRVQMSRFYPKNCTIRRV